MSKALTFELRLQSDFHVGAGHRKGTEIDSALLREHDGRPALRGSLLGQMLRDSARELFATPAMTKREYTLCKSSRIEKENGASDKDDNASEYCGQWQEHKAVCPICHVFGTPRTPRRWQFSSAWLQELQAGASAQGLGNEWGAQPVMRVRVSPATRRAEANKLFSEEIGDGRLIFRFEATWQGSGEPDEKEIALLAAAAANMRHIGKSRRRGRGLCRVQLIKADHPPLAKDWLELFKQELVDKKWQPEPHKPKIETPALSAELPMPAWQPVRVRIIAHLDEPVLVARRASAGNQFEGVTTLPGNILLGALAARATRYVDLREAGAYQNFVGLFRRGYARFSFLSLVHAEDTILYPSFAPPLDVFRCRQQPPHFDDREYHRTFALLESEEIRCDLCPKGDDAVDKLEKLQTLRFGDFGSNVELSVDKREEMHVQINPETQRAQDGKLFEYVCLQAGQYLCGEIVCRNQKVWDDLCLIAALQESKNTSIPLRLGKATRRGYGRVSAFFFVEKESEGFYQKTLRERLPDPKQPFTLLLTTDTIIRDKWGRFPTCFEDDWLSEALGMKITSKRGFAKTREIDGFQNYLGLPRWRDRAFIAGSVAGIQIIEDQLSNDEIVKKLEQHELEGIGLRRHEGFGQIVINHPVYEAIKNPDSGGSMSIEWKRKASVPIAGSDIEREREFRLDWEGILTQKGDKKSKDGQRWWQFEFKEFAPVARLLRARSDADIKSLVKELKSLGDFNLVKSADDMYVERKLSYQIKLGENQTPAPRETKKFFEKEDKGKPGIELIKEIFTSLDEAVQKKAPDDEKLKLKLRTIGIDMLALIIAEAANRAIKEGRNA